MEKQINKYINKYIFKKPQIKKIRSSAVKLIKSKYNCDFSKIKIIKKIFKKYDRKNLILKNYIYLSKIRNRNIKKNYINIYILIKLSFYLILKKDSEYNIFLNKIITNIIVGLKINKDIDVKINIQKFLDLDLKRISLFNMYASNISLIFLDLNKKNLNYYKYSYFLLMMVILNKIKKNNRDIQFFINKLNINKHINMFVCKMIPIFYNEIIIKNNKLI